MMNSLNFPLAEYPIMKSIIYSILKAYSITINSDEATLNENMIMRFIARGILSHARNGFITFEDFKNEMNGQMPPDMRLNIDNLYGLFAPIKNGLQYINEESLPFEIEQRFEFLFKIKKEWNQNEIEPFFVDFVTSKLSFQDFASRHVRLAEGKWMKR
ncbi:sister chromatid cohesion protein DCC1 [Histomonas meleagridis]|uniref:sister chromatid cohesion protein DCC1 n=1 Tax=Histomonas meleagridis TaxID=135588 RepID=UPI003559CDE1|nr:sister chromatid cohesion protein DCC1 [Histomonas meleagridis]KAH0799302.1 sister chromatid cohesion protein DCC1 [Histomonas meleagridis]